jgi:hypothetical protein
MNVDLLEIARSETIMLVNVLDALDAPSDNPCPHVI